MPAPCRSATRIGIGAVSLPDRPLPRHPTEWVEGPAGIEPPHHEKAASSLRAVGRTVPMDYTPIMQTVAELPEYIRAADKLLSGAERQDIIRYLTRRMAM